MVKSLKFPLIFIVTLFGVLTGCADSSSALTQVGYFKDERKFRVFAYAGNAFTESDVRNKGIAHTQGRPSVAFFYKRPPSSMPEYALDNQPSYELALSFAKRLDPDYVRVIWVGGDESFIDCNSNDNFGGDWCQ